MILVVSSLETELKASNTPAVSNTPPAAKPVKSYSITSEYLSGASTNSSSSGCWSSPDSMS